MHHRGNSIKIRETMFDMIVNAACFDGQCYFSKLVDMLEVIDVSIALFILHGIFSHKNADKTYT